jgi:hypothetical protein
MVLVGGEGVVDEVGRIRYQGGKCIMKVVVELKTLYTDKRTVVSMKENWQ